MKSIADELKEHSFFKDVSEADIELISGCGKNVFFKANDLVAREDNDADEFYLIRHGRMAIETAVAGKKPLITQTLGDGEICGWSWLFAPYKWTFDVVALEDTRAVAINGKCLRGKCQTDNRLGYSLMKKFAEILTMRLQQTRMQLMDIYGQQ